MLQKEKNSKEENMRYKYVHNEKRKKRIRAAIMRSGLLAMLLIVSTYAWFTSQKDITLSNLRGTVEVQENMEISLDAKTWHQKIDLSDAANVFAEAQASRDTALSESEGSRTTAIALLPSQMLPVSAVGETSSTLMPIYTGKATSTSLSDIEKCTEVDASGKAKDNGYFAFDIYIKNTSKDGEDDVLQLNLNSAVQVLTQGIAKKMENTVTGISIYEGDAASGLQNTVRVGLALYDGIEEATATQKEILDATKGANITDIAIWEPNASDHVEYIVSNNNKLINGTDTTTDLSFTASERVNTYALTSGAVTAGEITNVYDITSTGLDLQKTFKTEKTSTDDYRIKTTDSKPLNIQNIAEQDFKIKSNAVSRIRVYVWLEGQDVDCINVASQGGGIELDLGLTKDNETGEDEIQNISKLQEDYDFDYYSTLSGAVTDVNNETIGTNADATESEAVAGIYETADGKTSVVLLKDTVETSAITISKDTILNLGGKKLTLNLSASDAITGTGDLTIDGRIAGSDITMNSSATVARLMNIGTGIKYSINGGSYSIKSNTGIVIGIAATGGLELNDCKISAESGNNQVIAIMARDVATISNSNIYADSPKSTVIGILTQGNTTISNTKIFADSTYLADGTTLSKGIQNTGTLTLENCNVTGTQVGVTNVGNLYVNGGTYKSVGHGGFYFTGDENHEIYLNNAIIMDGVYEGKYDASAMDMYKAGFYVAGEDSSNLSIHFNNCTVSGQKTPFVLKGTSTGENNKVYMSNSNINLDKKIRIDSDTYELYIGKNCNFNDDNVTLPSAVTVTEAEYTK